MTAHWLLQMGWNVHVLRDALEGVSLEVGTPPPATELSPRIEADGTAGFRVGAPA